MIKMLELVRWCHKEADTAIKKARQAGPVSEEMWKARAIAMHDVVHKISMTINGKKKKEPAQQKIEYPWKGKNYSATTVKPK